jgi:hypothetical protein
MGDAAGDQQPVAAPAAEHEALEGRPRRRIAPEVRQPHQERRAGRHDPEILLIEVDVPGLDRAGL